MSVKMSGFTLDAVSNEIKHESSGFVLRTMAPKDNGGDGSSFSPTDLCAVSLGACVATTMGLFARTRGFDLHVAFSLEKEMAVAPRRIAKIKVHFDIKTNCSPDQYELLLAAGKACPVKKSLNPDVVIEESYARI